MLVDFTDVSGHRIGPVSRVKQSKKYDCLILEMGPICCPETSVNNYKHMLRYNPEKRKPNPWVIHACFDSDSQVLNRLNSS
jgi:hypothetical protein